jgi:protein tyrosine/serine phosphatase
LPSRIFLPLAVALALSVAPYSVQAANESSASLLQTRIANFEEVSPTIWRGSRPSDVALEDLAGSGVKTIVDLRLDGTGCEHEHVYARRLGLKYVHIPMSFKKPTSTQIVQFLNIVNDKNNQPVYVHCRQGADRTGTLIGIYRTVMQGWNFDKTYAEMRDHHFKPFLTGMKKTVAWFAANPESAKKLDGLIDYSKIETKTSVVAAVNDGG